MDECSTGPKLTVTRQGTTRRTPGTRTVLGVGGTQVLWGSGGALRPGAVGRRASLGAVAGAGAVAGGEGQAEREDDLRGRRRGR